MSYPKGIHVGTPPDSFEQIDSEIIYFHHFTRLRSGSYWSEQFTCAGYDWKLKLKTGGENDDRDGHLSLYLYNKSDTKVVLESYEFAALKGCIPNLTECMKRKTSEEKTFNPKDCKGWENFASRSDIFHKAKNILHSSGTLAIVVRIQPTKEYRHQPNRFDLGTQVFNDKTADMAFKVRDKIFNAHKQLLKLEAPALLELAEHSSKNDPLPIDDVEQDIFGSMLKHVYGKNIFPYFWIEHTKTILEASSRYGFTKLMMEAEEKYMGSYKLTVDNAVEELAYADGHSFKKMKDKASRFIIENIEEIISTPSWGDISNELKDEIVLKLAVGNRKRSFSSAFRE